MTSKCLMSAPLRGLGWVSVNKSAATRARGDSMRDSGRASETSKDSTSRRNSSSPAQAWSRKAARSGTGHSSAASSNSSTCFQRSGFIRHNFAYRPLQPRLCFAPLAFDSSRCDLQHLGHLFISQPAEELHLDDLAFARVHLREILQRVVEGDHIRRLFVHDRLLGKRHHLCTAASFYARATARVIYQDLPHQA